MTLSNDEQDYVQNDDQGDVRKIFGLVMDDAEVFAVVSMVMCRAMAVVSHIELNEPLDESKAGGIEEAAAYHAFDIHTLLRGLHSPEADAVAKSMGWRGDGGTLRRFVMNGIPPRTH